MGICSRFPKSRIYLLIDHFMIILLHLLITVTVLLLLLHADDFYGKKTIFFSFLQAYVVLSSGELDRAENCLERYLVLGFWPFHT